MFIRFIQRIAPLLLSIAQIPPTRVVFDGPPRRIQGAPITLVRRFDKVGRNEPCPCGSGLKAKKCTH